MKLKTLIKKISKYVAKHCTTLTELESINFDYQVNAAGSSVVLIFLTQDKENERLEINLTEDKYGFFPFCIAREDRDSYFQSYLEYTDFESFLTEKINKFVGEK